MRSGWTSYGERRFYFTYILSNNSMTLYVGMTNNLARRVSEHKRGEGSVFTSRYHFDRLVYFEHRPTCAMRSRGRSRKRKRKIDLIKSMNPKWIDLSAEWTE